MALYLQVHQLSGGGTLLHPSLPCRPTGVALIEPEFLFQGKVHSCRTHVKHSIYFFISIMILETEDRQKSEREVATCEIATCTYYQKPRLVPASHNLFFSASSPALIKA